MDPELEARHLNEGLEKEVSVHPAVRGGVVAHTLLACGVHGPEVVKGIVDVEYDCLDHGCYGSGYGGLEASDGSLAFMARRIVPGFEKMAKYENSASCVREMPFQTWSPTV